MISDCIDCGVLSGWLVDETCKEDGVVLEGLEKGVNVVDTNVSGHPPISSSDQGDPVTEDLLHSERLTGFRGFWATFSATAINHLLTLNFQPRVNVNSLFTLHIWNSRSNHTIIIWENWAQLASSNILRQCEGNLPSATASPFASAAAVLLSTTSSNF